MYRVLVSAIFEGGGPSSISNSSTSWSNSLLNFLRRNFFFIVGFIGLKPSKYHWFRVFVCGWTSTVFCRSFVLGGVGDALGILSGVLSGVIDMCSNGDIDRPSRISLSTEESIELDWLRLRPAESLSKHAFIIMISGLSDHVIQSVDKRGWFYAPCSIPFVFSSRGVRFLIT